jgi:hypothetical protein
MGKVGVRLWGKNGAVSQAIDKPAAGARARARGRSVVGLALCAGGAAFAAYGMLHPSAPIQPDPFIALPIGVVFACAGMLIAFPNATLEVKSICGTLLITGFAVILDWIAFGPGERHFSGSVGSAGISVRSPTNDLAGRIVFGIGAVAVDALALFWWVKLFKLLAAVDVPKPPTSQP